ncbi:MAG: InlB B-repeat-containing protein [bacterium]
MGAFRLRRILYSLFLSFLVFFFSAGFMDSAVYGETLTVSVNPVEGGNILVDGDTTVSDSDSFTFTAGETVTLGGIAEQYWEFDGWSGDTDSSQDTIVLTMDANKDVKANFARKMYKVSIDIGGEGVVLAEGNYYDDTNTQHTFKAGETITVEARADDYWEFEEWVEMPSNDKSRLSGTDPKKKIFVDTDNIYEQASFIKKDFILEVDVAGEGEVVVDGETTVEGNQTFTFEAEDTVALKATAEAAEYKHWQFDDWSVDGSGSDSEIIVTMDRDKLTRANFKRKMYQLTVSVASDSPLESGLVFVDGDTVGKYEQSDTFLFESEKTVDLEAVASNHWKFDTWAGDVNDENSAQTTIEMDTDGKSVTGNFSREGYELVLNLNPDDGGQVTINGDTKTSSGTFTYDAEEELDLVAEPGTHWNFDGWSGDKSSSDTTIQLEMDGNKELDADFNRKEYSLDLTVDPAGEGEVVVDGNETCTGSETFQYESETSHALEASPANKHWVFDHWSGDTAGINPNNPQINVNLDTDIALTANFKRDTYTLEVEVKPETEGRVTVNDDTSFDTTGTFVFKSEENIKLSANSTSKHWLFENWSGDTEATSDTINLQLLDNTTVYANFSRDSYTLTVRADSDAGGYIQAKDGGIDTTVQQEKEFEFTSGDTLNLEAFTANRHWLFAGWSGDIAGTTASEVQVVMDGDKTIVGEFVRDTYVLTIKVNPPEGGSVKVDPAGGGGTSTVLDTKTLTYNSESKVDLTAKIAGSLWGFVEWSGSVDLLADTEAASTTVTLDTDAVIQAEFNELQVRIKRPFSDQIWGDTTLDVKIDYSALTGDFILVEMDGQSNVKLDLELSTDTESAETTFTNLEMGKKYEVKATIYDENQSTVSDTTIFETERSAINREFSDVEKPYIEYSDPNTGYRRTLRVKDGNFSGDGAVSISSRKGRWKEWVEDANGEAGEQYSAVKGIADRSLTRIEMVGGKPGDRYILEIELPEGNPEDFDFYRLNKTPNPPIWKEVNLTQLDSKDNRVRVEVDSFSEFQLLRNENFSSSRKFQNLVVGPNPLKVSKGQNKIIFQFENYDEYTDGEEKIDFELKIYTVTGRLVESRSYSEFSEVVEGKYYQLHWPGAGDVATGHYVYRLKDNVSGEQKSGQLVITR